MEEFDDDDDLFVRGGYRKRQKRNREEIETRRKIEKDMHS